jgi:tetratricopeptide (TPR) repeat protein
MLSNVLKKSWVAAVVIAIAMGAVYFLRHREPLPNPELATPKLAVASLHDSRIFFNPFARVYLLKTRRDLLSAEDRDDRSERTRDFALASLNPRLWRQLDRKEHFNVVLLSGDPAFYRALLEHLAGSTDWTLTYLDHTSFIFLRAPAKAWQSADLQIVREKFSTLPSKQRADFLVQIADKLLAIKQRDVAKVQLDDALRLDDKSAAAWTALAVYHVQLKQFPDALDAVDKALVIEKKFVPALETKTQVLLPMHRANEAFEVSQNLIDLAPQDTTALFLHARAAHEAHAYTSEIATLEKLIKLLQDTKQSVSGCRIYLGQAHAEKGESVPALEQFQLAFGADDLDPAQRAFVKETIARIKERSGL